MKTVKAICATMLLSFLLSVPALGGEIGSPGSPQPTPTPVTTTGSETSSEPTEPGDICTPGYLDLFLQWMGLS